MLPPLQLNQAIDELIREEWGRMLAVLIGTCGQIQLAEDVLHDAVESALSHWSENGLPDSPAAWIIQTAKRRHIDRYRRSQKFKHVQAELLLANELADQELSVNGIDEVDVFPDKRLELIFTCCHPALDLKSQVALTLKTLGGLQTDEIAHAFLDKPATMAQRLTRAKKKIVEARIPYAIPDKELWDTRLQAVLSVIYFIFNEGYASSSGAYATRSELCDEAIRLARITQLLLPDETETTGLLALMLLHDSRRRTRYSHDNQFIALQDQNRRHWDKQKIEEGTTLLQLTLAKQKIGTYQLQAIISAIHSQASHWEETDWVQISGIYALLYSMMPTPVVRINHAVAVSYAQSPKAAMDMLETLNKEARVKDYQPFYAAHADICQRSGHLTKARESMKRAIELTGNDMERAFLTSRLTAI